MSPSSDHKVATHVHVMGVEDVVVVDGRPDQKLAAVAAAQRGRVTFQQLRRVGFSRSMIRARVHRGSLHALHRGVYAVGHAGRIELGDETAALLAYGYGYALSHHTAVWLHGLLRRDPEDIHLIGPPGATAKSRPGIYAHHSRTFTPADVVLRKGLPVARPALALLQLGEACEDRELELAVDEALATRLVSRTKLREVLAVHGRGRCGASRLAELVDPDRATSVTRSEGEERLRKMILAAGLPAPEMNAPLHGFVADFHWPKSSYVVEFDGFAFHSSRSVWRRDRAKDRTYAANGLRLDRFTWEDISDRPLATIAHITRQIAERSPSRAR